MAKSENQNQDIIEAERRAAERRAAEALAREKADATAADSAAADAEAEAKAERARLALLPAVEKRRTELRPLPNGAREKALKLRSKADALDRAAGDLEGAIISARDVARTDPKRALAALDKAEAAFNAAIK